VNGDVMLILTTCAVTTASTQRHAASTQRQSRHTADPRHRLPYSQQGSNRRNVYNKRFRRLPRGPDGHVSFYHDVITSINQQNSRRGIRQLALGTDCPITGYSIKAGVRTVSLPIILSR